MSEPSKETETINELKDFVGSGIHLIKSGDFKKAITHFRSPETAEKLGFYYERSPYEIRVTKSEFTKDEVKTISDGCARYSYFDHGFRASPGRPQLSISNVVPVPESLETPMVLLENVALIHIEEWLHALQYLEGKSIAGIEDPEKDVAAYLYKEGVHLTEEFLDRNGRREVVKS